MSKEPVIQVPPTQKSRVGTSLGILLMLLVSVALLPAAVFVGYASAERRDDLREHVEREGFGLALQAGAEYQRQVQAARQTMSALAQWPELHTDDADACRKRLSSLIDGTNSWAGVGVVEADGSLFCATRNDTLPSEIPRARWFLDAMAGNPFGDGNFYASSAHDFGFSTYGFPLAQADGQVDRVLYVNLILTWPNVERRLVDNAPGTTLMAWDGEGRVVARSSNAVPLMGEPTGGNRVVADMLSKREGVVSGSLLGDIERMFAFVPLTAAAAAEVAVVAVGVPLEAAFAKADRALVRNLAALGVVAALSFGGAWFVGERYIHRPVQATVDASRRFRSGDLRARAGSFDDREHLGGLTSAFDQMADEVERQRLALLSAQSAQRKLNDELEDRVRERTADLQETVKELEAFTYTVSHDLRSPLRTIHGLGQALREDYSRDLSPEALRLVDRIQSSSTRMASLIDDLLELSRVGRAPLNRVRVDLSRMAQDILGDLRRADSRRNADVRIDPGLSAVGDPGLVHILLQNLLENAWKFTSNTRDASIEIVREPTSEGEAFVVRDNGAGFDMAYAEKLFEPFTRLHRDAEYEGTGIGLATVRRIVERHGGRICAEGKPGRGASFIFTLGSDQLVDVS